jgi:hypothetical protein
MLEGIIDVYCDTKSKYTGKDAQCMWAKMDGKVVPVLN